MTLEPCSYCGHGMPDHMAGCIHTTVLQTPHRMTIGDVQAWRAQRPAVHLRLESDRGFYWVSISSPEHVTYTSAVQLEDAIAAAFRAWESYERAIKSA